MPARTIVMSLVVAVGVVMLALPYDAAADCRDRISLSPTVDGEAIAAIGRAETWSENAGAQQTFMVEVAAAVPDGSQLFVFANGESAGAMTIDSGIGALDLGNVNGGSLPAGVDSVCSIGPISVTDANGMTLLSGF